nr:hypothetical protein A5881_003783 [Enterococcus termitis]
MLVNTLGFLANLTSLILWIPQARVTLKNRGNIQRLRGISTVSYTHLDVYKRQIKE